VIVPAPPLDVVVILVGVAPLQSVCVAGVGVVRLGCALTVKLNVLLLADPHPFASVTVQ
jgi:hypothetical protein